MIYKFTIGQRVKVAIEDRWLGDYFKYGCVAKYNYILNGKSTYDIKISRDETLYAIREDRVSEC